MTKVTPWPKVINTLNQKRGTFTKPKSEKTRITLRMSKKQIIPKVTGMQAVLYCKNLIFFSWLSVRKTML